MHHSEGDAGLPFPVSECGIAPGAKKVRSVYTSAAAGPG